MKLPASVAAIGRVDEERVRKIAADNPDLLHTRLAQRFGISVGRLRKVLGLHGAVSELLDSKEMAAAHYTPRPGGTHAGWQASLGRLRKADWIRNQLRAEADGARVGFERSFKPMRRPNGRGGPGDKDSR